MHYQCVAVKGSWWPGARFSKVPKTFRARKAIRKAPTCLFCKAGLFICCVKGIKKKITAKFRASRRLSFEDTKRIMSPEMRPKHFGTFEKQASGQLTQKETRQLGEQNQRYPPTPPHDLLHQREFSSTQVSRKASNLRGGEKIFATENSISPQVNSSQLKLDQSSFLISPLAGIFPP